MNNVFAKTQIAKPEEAGNVDQLTKDLMRTWKPFYKSRPGRPLLIAMILVLLVTLALPYSPLSEILGLKPLPLSWLVLLALITILYAGVSEVTKKFFYAKLFVEKRAVLVEGTAIT